MYGIFTYTAKINQMQVKVTIHGSYVQFSGEPNAKTQGDAGPQEHVSYLQRGCRSPLRMLHETGIST